MGGSVGGWLLPSSRPSRSSRAASVTVGVERPSVTLGDQLTAVDEDAADASIASAPGAVILARTVDGERDIPVPPRVPEIILQAGGDLDGGVAAKQDAADGCGWPDPAISGRHC